MSTIDINTLDRTDGLYKITFIPSSGKNAGIQLTVFVKKYAKNPDVWLAVVADTGELWVCPRRAAAPGSGWHFIQVVELSFHPNMDLKGVPAIKTD